MRNNERDFFCFGVRKNIYFATERRNGGKIWVIWYSVWNRSMINWSVYSFADKLNYKIGQKNVKEFSRHKLLKSLKNEHLTNWKTAFNINSFKAKKQGFIKKFQQMPIVVKVLTNWWKLVSIFLNFGFLTFFIPQVGKNFIFFIFHSLLMDYTIKALIY